MAKRIVLTVGTRKGCFLLESDEERRDWQVRGPVLRRLAHLPRAARSRLGADLRVGRQRVARRRRVAKRRPGRDVGALERGHRLPRGRAQALEGHRASRSRTAGCGSAPRPPACSRAATAARPGRSSARSTASPAAARWNDPAKQPPGHLGMPALLPHPDDPDRYLVVVQGYGIFETADGGGVVGAAQPRAARRVAARGRPRSATASTSSCCRRPTASGSTSRTTAACTGATTPATPGRR